MTKANNNRQSILVVEDDAELRGVLVESLHASGYRVVDAEDGETALTRLARQQVDLVLSDMRMGALSGDQLLQQVKTLYPHLPVVLITGQGSIPEAVQMIRAGAADYLAKPFELQELLTVLEQQLARSQMGADESLAIAEDPATRALYALALRAANTSATILISGPSGSGKEVLARTLHLQSSRSVGPFVAINCAAIPDNMLEATLFGYEKGAFTGAVQSTPGKFEQAQGGTLLLDEVSEMTLELQAKLLRVLQEKEVERLGGRKTISLDVRVVATTNRDLGAAVAEHQFREDLYYRLAVFPLNLLPLAQRPLDILPLAEHLLLKHRDEYAHPGVVFADEARTALQQHPWPGNVRELENLVQRALIMVDQNLIQVRHLLFGEMLTGTPRETSESDPAPERAEDGLRESVEQHEQARLVEVINSSPTRKEAAARLGISERTLRYKLARLRQTDVAQG